MNMNEQDIGIDLLDKEFTFLFRVMHRWQQQCGGGIMCISIKAHLLFNKTNDVSSTLSCVFVFVCPPLYICHFALNGEASAISNWPKLTFSCFDCTL